MGPDPMPRAPVRRGKFGHRDRRSHVKTEAETRVRCICKPTDPKDGHRYQGLREAKKDRPRALIAGFWLLEL